jgi:hypothetical protein
MRGRATRGKLIYENPLWSIAMVWENATRLRLSARLLTAARIRGKHIRPSFVPQCTATHGVLVAKIDYSPRHVCPSVHIPTYRVLWKLVYGTLLKFVKSFRLWLKLTHYVRTYVNLKYLIVIHMYDGFKSVFTVGHELRPKKQLTIRNNRALSIANHMICNTSMVAMCQLWLIVDLQLRHGEVLHCVLCKTCKGAFKILAFSVVSWV